MRTVGITYPSAKDEPVVAHKKATKADLIKQAEAMGVEVSNSMTVAQIKKAIEQAQA